MGRIWPAVSLALAESRLLPPTPIWTAPSSLPRRDDTDSVDTRPTFEIQRGSRSTDSHQIPEPTRSLPLGLSTATPFSIGRGDADCRSLPQCLRQLQRYNSYKGLPAQTRGRKQRENNCERFLPVENAEEACFPIKRGCFHRENGCRTSATSVPLQEVESVPPIEDIVAEVVNLVDRLFDSLND